MQENYLFEYAVIRVVPRVEREEFLNVGVILYCRKLQFLEVLFELNNEKLQAFCSQLEIEDLNRNLTAFKRISEGGVEGGPIGQLDLAGRFRWLTATRSTVLQSSKVHPGFCTDPKETLAKLYDQLVL